MDSAITGTRKYPAYTTKELEDFIASGKGNPVMVQEVADRKSGESLTFHQMLNRHAT